MNKYDDFISGERFQFLADYIIGPGNTEHIQYNYQTGMGKYPIVYAHTHNAMQAMQWIHKYNQPCVLITHNSDGRVKAGKDTGPNDIHANDCPENVVRWYAQNVDVKYDIPSYITPLPIGLENKYCFPYDKAKMLFDRPERLNPPSDFYLNFNVHTNPTERLECLSVFQELKKDPWYGITIDMHQNGDDYHHYLNEIMRHKIVVSPEGNGLDCHRTWEALYMNRCVLVKSNETMKQFAKLENKILLIDDWNDMKGRWLDILKQFFITRTHTLQANKPNILSLDYWKERIYNGT